MVEQAWRHSADVCDFEERGLEPVIVTGQLPFAIEEASSDPDSMDVDVDDGDGGIVVSVSHDPRRRLRPGP